MDAVTDNSDIGRRETLRRLESVRYASESKDEETRNAFAAIRDERLFLQTHADFASYCLDRWGMCSKKIDDWIATGLRPRNLFAQKPVEKSASKSFVYFVYAPEASLVKIGVTNCLRSRMCALRTGSPVRLVVLGTIEGDAKYEKRLHRFFGKHRSHGEWFRLSESIVCFIRDKCEATEWFSELLKSNGESKWS